MENELSHVDSQGKPVMVDVGAKKITVRKAQAQGSVILPAFIAGLLQNGEINGPKGPVFQTAILAGTMAAKKTSELIPFCHPLNLDWIHVEISMGSSNSVLIESHVSVEAKTGAEMEALVAVNVAALTIYDMCKALSHDIIIGESRLIKKSGGKHDINLGSDSVTSVGG